MAVSPVRLITVNSVIKVWIFLIKASTQKKHVRGKIHIKGKTASDFLMKKCINKVISALSNERFCIAARLRVAYVFTPFVKWDVGILFSF